MRQFMNHLSIDFGCLLILFNLFICHNSYAMVSERCGPHTIYGHEIWADLLVSRGNCLSKMIKRRGQFHVDNSDDSSKQVMVGDSNKEQRSKLIKKWFSVDNSENKKNKTVCIKWIQKILSDKKKLKLKQAFLPIC